MKPQKVNKIDKIKIILIWFLFFLCAIYITFPLFFHLSEYVTGLGDELFIAYVQNWVLHALSTNPLSIFNASIYFPYENTLAFSETFITTSIFAVSTRIFGEPISTVNSTFLNSLALLGFSTYLLCFFITKNHLSSIVGGLLVIFSPVVIDKKVHLQLLSIEFVVVSALMLVRYFQNPRFKYVIGLSILFLLQVYNSLMPVYFILFFYITFFIVLFFYQKEKIKLFINKKIFIVAVATILLTLPIFIPYYSVSKKLDAKRDIRDAIHFALQPEDLLFVENYSRVQNLLLQIENPSWYKNASVKPGFIGLYFSLLVLAAFIAAPWYIKRKKLYYVSFLSAGALGLVLSFGPALHFDRVTIHPIIPLPYALFYYIIPGFNGLRNSARFEMMFVIFMTVPISILLNDFLKNRAIRDIAFVMLALGIVFEFNGPIHFEKITQVKDFPKEHFFLSKTPKDSAYIELPIYNWNMSPYAANELKREYYSTIHFRKSVNGFSGFSPIPWQNFIYDTMSTFPNDSSIITLQKMGVNYIIIHRDEFDQLSKDKFVVKDKVVPSSAQVTDALNKNNKLNLVVKYKNVDIYKINK